jgi:FkbM family methyltransferase
MIGDVPVVNTRRLFRALLPVLEIDTVCDVGSMNGADALDFRRVLPAAQVHAFEANPRNAQQMRDDARLRTQRIEVVPFAVTNFDGTGVFHLVKADYSTPNHRRGMSSLLERTDARLHDGNIETRTVRLDSYLARDPNARRRLALWVDVEGKACEAIEGASGLFDELLLLHVEVETTACIAAAQKLYPEVKRMLLAAGFAELATDQPPHYEQFNALFVRAALPFGQRLRVVWHVAGNALRWLIVRFILRACPACAQHLIRMRQGREQA